MRARIIVCTFAWFMTIAGYAEPGTTVITHGYQFLGDLPEWTQTMANGILSRASVPGNNAPTTLVYDPNTGAWQYVEGGQDADEELILIYDWAEESNWVPLAQNRKGTAVAAADAVYAALRDPQQLRQPESGVRERSRSERVRIRCPLLCSRYGHSST